MASMDVVSIDQVAVRMPRPDCHGQSSCGNNILSATCHGKGGQSYGIFCNSEHNSIWGEIAGKLISQGESC